MKLALWVNLIPSLLSGRKEGRLERKTGSALPDSRVKDKTPSFDLSFFNILRSFFLIFIHPLLQSRPFFNRNILLIFIHPRSAFLILELGAAKNIILRCDCLPL